VRTRKVPPTNASNRLVAEQPMPIPPDKLKFPFGLKFTKSPAAGQPR
jgi:hypothetical protein